MRTLGFSSNQSQRRGVWEARQLLRSFSPWSLISLLSPRLWGGDGNGASASFSLLLLKDSQACSEAVFAHPPARTLAGSQGGSAAVRSEPV